MAEVVNTVEAKVDPVSKDIAAKYKAHLESQNAKKNGAADAKPPADDKPQDPPPTPNEDEIFQKKLKEKYGVEDESVLQGLLTKKPTEEENKIPEGVQQQQILNEYLGSGNTLEQYNEIQKKISRSDEDLAKEAFVEQYKDELKDLKEDEIDEEFRNYYQLDSANEKATKRGEARIAKKAKEIREEITAPIKKAEQTLKSKGELTSRKSKWENEVETFFNAENGELSAIKYTDEKHGEVEIKVPDDIYNQVKGFLKDPAALAASFQSEMEKEGKKTKVTDKKKFAQLLIKGLVFDKALSDVAESAYGRGVKDSTKNNPPAPDFSKTGGDGTQKGNTAAEKMKAAVEHNQRVSGR